MADCEFEELNNCFEKLEKNRLQSFHSIQFYSLVHNIAEESPISKIGSESDCDLFSENTNIEDTEQHIVIQDNIDGSYKPIERRRRKLPQIPKNKKSSAVDLHKVPSLKLSKKLSLAEELKNSESEDSLFLTQSCNYLWDEDSPDSDRFINDVDSGHSTAHSPTGTEGFKSISPVAATPPYHNLETNTGCRGIEVLEATHRGLYKFIPRHDDEIEIEIGDPLYVQKETDDLWCEGLNLRSGRTGIFPSAYCVDCDYTDWDTTGENGRRERYLLGYLGSVETLAHKGMSVVCQSVKRVIGSSTKDPPSQPCILEISDHGLRMVDRRKRRRSEPCIDYFYSLKNVSFCAFHPRDHRYLGFITKHPRMQRFACHVFRGLDSTRPVAEAVGRAFQRFYQKFIETAYPIEDIYIE